MLCKMEMKETANCDSVRCQKFRDCFHTMSWLYRVHMLVAGQPSTTLAALFRLVPTCRNYASTCQAVNSDDFERRIKQHHIDHHLPHAAAWWGRTMMTAENQEGCNPFLRSVYDSSNKCSPVVAIANFCAARINAKFLRLAAESIRACNAVPVQSGEAPLFGEASLVRLTMIPFVSHSARPCSRTTAVISDIVAVVKPLIGAQPETTTGYVSFEGKGARWCQLSERLCHVTARAGLWQGEHPQPSPGSEKSFQTLQVPPHRRAQGKPARRMGSQREVLGRCCLTAICHSFRNRPIPHWLASGRCSWS